MRRPRNKGQLGHAESLKRNTMMEHVHITSEDRVKRIAKDACSMMDERTSGLDKLNKTLRVISWKYSEPPPPNLVLNFFFIS